MSAHHNSSLLVSPDRSPARSNLLGGWKNIANYLGKAVRTAQRYERDLRLPVRRPSGIRGSVMAFRLELEQWILKRQKNPPDAAGLDSQHLLDLKTAISELRSLYAAGLDGGKGARRQSTAPHSGIERVQVLSDSDFSLKMERHQGIASQQKELAKEMIETARETCARAIEMRRQSHRPLAINW